MSADLPFTMTPLVKASSDPQPRRNWWLRRICSQNPFYLLSVCFVLHGTAQWFHSDSGIAFSPWPLLGLTAAYTLLLALTGLVIIRFGRVWDDARSILLIILLLFVQMSLIFDETLVRDPRSGHLLQLIGWAFAIVLSELLLRGLQIKLPWPYRLPYHGLIALLFLYPLLLVAVPVRMSPATVQWRIFLFSVVAAGILIALIPAVRRGSQFIKHNGTPWQWPWYPWSLFVFLGVCICFRAYALCLSFDAVLDESLNSAMRFTSVFGVYFLIPLILATGALLLEIGIVEQLASVTRVAMFVPVVCLYLSLSPEIASRPYHAFVGNMLAHIGSPLWLTMLGSILFYLYALIRRAPHADQWLGVALLIAIRITPQMLNLSPIVSAPQIWPLALLGIVELCLGILRKDSHAVFVSLCSAIGCLYLGTAVQTRAPIAVQVEIAAGLFMASVLLVGAICRDDFAWFLRLLGAPSLVVATIASCVLAHLTRTRDHAWASAAVVLSMTLIALIYAEIVRMPLYHLSSLLCATSGTLGLTELAVYFLIRETGWRGATSFVSGLGWLLIAIAVSSWKAGWLNRIPHRLRRMLVA